MQLFAGYTQLQFKIASCNGCFVIVVIVVVVIAVVEWEGETERETFFKKDRKWSIIM